MTDSYIHDQTKVLIHLKLFPSKGKLEKHLCVRMFFSVLMVNSIGSDCFGVIASIKILLNCKILNNTLLTFKNTGGVLSTPVSEKTAVNSRIIT
jgi:high-affinity nickel permease